MRGAPRFSKGFTLVEMIMVMVITGILGGMVAVFLKHPIQQYMDMSRRAELTDIADTALYRLAGDVSTAVPNSIRVAGCGASPCFEFLPTRDGGRYRSDLPGDPLVFDGADTTFDVIGPADVAANDRIVIGSASSDGGMAYGEWRAVTAVAGANITLNAGLPLTAELPTRRFDVIDGGAVTYACVGAGVNASGDGTGVLRRYWNYGVPATQANPPAGATTAILADRVSGCAIDYDVPNQRMGLLGIRLTLAGGGESVSLYHEIHVNNIP
jgi:MSHA biogenesis protein MshO